MTMASGRLVRQLDHTRVWWRKSGLLCGATSRSAVCRLRSPTGETIFDFARTWSVGCACARRGPEGTTITLRHAEVLDQEGNLYTGNLRRRQTTCYTLKGATDATRYSSLISPFRAFDMWRWRVFPRAHPRQPYGIVLHSTRRRSAHLNALAAH